MKSENLKTKTRNKSVLSNFLLIFFVVEFIVWVEMIEKHVLNKVFAGKNKKFA